MKSLKSFLFLLSLIFFLNHSSLAASAKEKDWEKIYSTEVSKSRSNLGRQCALRSDAEYKAFLKTQTDPELQMSPDDFNQKLKQAGIILPYSDSNPNDFGKQSFCYLSENEYLAIRAYTGSNYAMINTALRTLDLKELQSYRVLIKFMLAGLAKLKNYEGYVKRGTSLQKSRLANCKPGAVFADRGFLSTSLASGFGSEYKFVIQSKTCKYIAPFSMFGHEEEVLCLPGTVFQIRYLPEVPDFSEKKILVEEVAQAFDIDNLIQTLKANPKLQHPKDAALLGQSCQPLSSVDIDGE